VVLGNAKKANVFVHLVTTVILVKARTTCVHLKIVMATERVILLFACATLVGKDPLVKLKSKRAQTIVPIMGHAIPLLVNAVVKKNLLV
jgi:hypothetical protein